MRGSPICSFAENWNEWECDQHETEQQGIAGKLSI